MAQNAKGIVENGSLCIRSIEAAPEKNYAGAVKSILRKKEIENLPLRYVILQRGNRDSSELLLFFLI